MTKIQGGQKVLVPPLVAGGPTVATFVRYENRVNRTTRRMTRMAIVRYDGGRAEFAYQVSSVVRKAR